MTGIRVIGVAAAFAVLALAAGTGPHYVSTAVAAAASQDDKIATTNGDLTIHPVHHAGIVFTWNGKTIVVDPSPYPPDPNKDASADFKTANPPDVITVGHEHGDHFNVPTLKALAGPNTKIVVPQDVANMIMDAGLKAKVVVMKNGDKQTVNGIAIEAVAAYNTSSDRLMFHPKGRDNGYIFTLGGKRVYVSGDTEEAPELKSLPNIDVAFVCINLPYTQTAEAAAQWVKDFKPKVVYPYHTQGMPSGDVAKFAMLVGTASEVRQRKWY